MTIGVYSMFDEVFQPVADITLPVLVDYCERHGYPLTIATERLSDQRVVWDKIPLLLENLHLNDWSFFIEADLLITNPEIKLESFIVDACSGNPNSDSDIIATCDVNGPNFGVFFIRNSTRARVVLSDAWHMRNRADVGSEQHALIDACEGCEGDISKAKVIYVRQDLFNSYPYAAYAMDDTTEGNWTPGDFAMHLPGMTVAKRVEIFTRHLAA